MRTADEVLQTLKKLAGTRVLVGIPSTGANRLGEASPATQIENATLAYIHEMGSPANNLPARPFLRPGIENSQANWEPYLRQAAEAAFKGDAAGMDKALNAAGTVARDAVKAKITAGIPPPIKPQSMAQRRRHAGRPGLSKREQAKRAGQRAGYRGFYERYEAGVETSVPAGGVTPLIDTAQMLNSITYTVKS